MIFLLLHGSFGSPDDAWFPWLRGELESSGHVVIAPQFPIDRWEEVTLSDLNAYVSRQNLSSWNDTLEPLLPRISDRDDVCVVGHSMGTLYTLHMVSDYPVSVARAYFVAPFLYPATQEELRDPSVARIDKANASFYRTDFDYALIRSRIMQSTVFYSDDDPYISEQESLEFSKKLGSRVVQLHGLGHMGTEAGLHTFPELLDIIASEP